MKKCSIEGCEGKYHARGYCQKHLRQFKRNGKIPERIITIPNDYIIQMGVIIGNDTEPSDIVVMNCYNKKSEKICEFIFDLEDLDKVKNHKWSLNNGYIVKNMNKKKIYLHNYLFDDNKIGQSMRRDHININKLDNRKCNLRTVTNSLSGANRNIYKNNTSGFKGVVVIKNKNNIKYKAQINFNYKNIRLGNYNTPEEAHEVYKNKCRELHGEHYLDNI